MKTTYNSVLVGLDYSKQSEKAFNKAVKIAKQSDANLILANVIDIRQFTYAIGDRENLIKECEKHAEELLSKYEEKAKNAGVKQIIKIVYEGSPKSKIPGELSKKFDVDLIVCGATGYNAIERILLGSVSESIVRHAKCDVLVVRE